jgi:hypothetical protein
MLIVTGRHGVSILAIAALALGTLAAPLHATAVRSITGLESITFYERTGGVGPTPFTFTVDSPQLTTRLSDPLATGNNDISGAFTEFYDVFYSNQDGSFNLDGEFLTIEGVFLQPLPAGGGLNLAEIGLNFSGDPEEFGNTVASFFANGDNAVPGDVDNAIDGDLLTHTTMGNTLNSDARLRVTLGFESSSGPPDGGPPVIPLPTALSQTLAALAMGAVVFSVHTFCRRWRLRA